LHLKIVSAVDIDRVAALGVDYPECKAFFQRQRGWLDEPARYEDMLARPGGRESRIVRKAKPRFAFSEQDARAMLGIKYRAAAEKPRAYCSGWPRDEKEGTRRRPLMEPYLNDQFRRRTHLGDLTADLEYMRQSLNSEVRQRVAQHAYALLFDFASWYDQLALAPEVRKYFGLRIFGEDYVLNCLPMGFRASCNVAQAVTWMLVDFIGKYGDAVHVDTCIDNVRFTADDPTVLREVGREFVRRCEYVGATLNPYSLDPVQEYEYLGVRYSHVQKTRQLSDKSVRKLDACSAINALPNPKRRQVAAVFGMLFFAADVVRNHTTSPANFYDALRFYRTEVASVSEDSSAWDDPVVLPVSIRHDIASWIVGLQRAPPTPVVTPPSPYDIIVVTDASEFGWGALAVDPKTGSMAAAEGTWSAMDRRWNLGRSTESEPLGILKGLLRFVSPAAHRSVLVLTDHTGVTHAVRQGHGRSPAYNNLVLQCARLFPGVQVDAAYIPGSENPVDGASRGLQVAPLDLQHDSALADVLLERARTRGKEREEERGREYGVHGKWMV
jgi:hypothetical protein